MSDRNTQVVDVYRTKIRGDVEGIEGDEIARKRVEDYANSIRPKGFLVRPTCLFVWSPLKITFRTMSPFIPLILGFLHQHLVMRTSKENKKTLR
jgi:hypothetical protein